MNHLQRFIFSLFFYSWWTIAFILAIGILYEQGLKEPKFLYTQLKEQVIALQDQKKQALQQQKNLQLQINSQSDLAWVELTLMKGLGLVPEGQEKVYFYPAATNSPQKK